MCRWCADRRRTTNCRKCWSSWKGSALSKKRESAEPEASDALFDSTRSRKPEAGSLVRITGLDDRQTDKCFETEFTSRLNPHRGYITIIEGCDKFCAYCVVPFTRGKERSRTSQSVLNEARQMADLGYTEIQLLGQNVNSYRDPDGKKLFAELLAAVGEVPGIRRVRFTTSHPRDFGRDIVDVDRCCAGAVRSRAFARPERIDARARRHAAALYARTIS